MKRAFILLTFILFSSPMFAETQTRGDVEAYIVYQQGNEKYKVKDNENAKKYYLQVMNQYPDSKYVPYAVYMLSFMETDYVRIIDYLTLIKDQYPEFKYWTNSIEKLGDIFYVMGNHAAAIDQYKLITTDKAFYMLSLIYSANNFPDQAIDQANKLLIQTKDNSLAYKGILIELKTYMDQGKYAESYPLLQKAISYKPWSFDNGARILYYSGKYYFARKDILKHFEKSLYIFSLLKTSFPLSAEAAMANTYLDGLKKQNITGTDEVRWIADAYGTPESLAYQSQPVTTLDEVENKAEKISSQAEGAAGQMVKADLMEYVVRVGEYKDLSVANLVATDIVRHGQSVPLGIYYRNDLYYAEIRGIKTIDEAKNLAKKMLELGYNDTKVVEFMKVVQYNK